ncbi:MAG TPA: hypothetical protein PK245_06620, partial [Clostridia bacterium]|nr:hypothetical protein [Clostridia bacterium]
DMEQGLYWTTGYNGDQVIDVKADSEEGAAAFDPAMPTVIITHGVQMGNGRNGKMDFCELSGEHDISSYNFEGIFENGVPPEGRFQLSEIYFNLGYNVGIFHYENFCDSASTEIEGFGQMEIDFYTVERNVATTDYGCKAMNINGETSDGDAIKGFSVSQFYAAEYLRAMKRVGAYDASHEIIFMAHSMGGFVTTLSSHLITELVRVGQLDAAFIPDRISLQDSFVGTGKFISGNADAPTLAWTGKTYIDGSSRMVYMACLENLVLGYDIAVEFICLTGKMVSFFAGLIAEECDFGLEFIRTLTTYTEIATYYKGINIPIIDGHNDVREFYMISKAADPLQGEYQGEAVDIPLASLSTEKIKSLRGYCFIMDESGEYSDNFGGRETIEPVDDTYIITRYCFDELKPQFGTLVKKG